MPNKDEGRHEELEKMLHLVFRETVTNLEFHFSILSISNIMAFYGVKYQLASHFSVSHL